MGLMAVRAKRRLAYSMYSVNDVQMVLCVAKDKYG